MDHSSQLVLNAEVSAILRLLPTETLITIFLLAVEHGPHPQLTSKKRPSEALSHVCHRFRQIVLDIPAGWDIIDFPLFWSSTSLSHYVSKMRERARDLPLYVIVRDGDCDAWNADVHKAFRLALKDANIHHIGFYLGHRSMELVPHKLTLTLSAPPRSLLLCRTDNQRVPSRFQPIQRQKPNPCIDHCVFPRNYILAAIESIELVDIGLRFQDMSDKVKMAWTSFRYRRSPHVSGQSVAIPRDLLFLCCPRLERMDIDGSLLLSRSFSSNVPLTPPHSLREVYLYEGTDMEPNWMVANQPPILMPRLRKLGMGLFQIARIHQILSNHSKIEELTFGRENRSLSTVELDQILAVCPCLVKLTIPASWITKLLRSVSVYDEITNESRPWISSVDHLQIDDALNMLTINIFEKLVTACIRLGARANACVRISIKFSKHTIMDLSEIGVRRALFPWTKSRYYGLAEVCWTEDVCEMRWARIAL